MRSIENGSLINFLPFVSGGFSSAKISVIVPVYNSEKFISQTIKSILSQEAVIFELIIIDDCSTDKTAKLIHSAAAQDARVKYLRMKTNSGGPAGPRNLGVKNASGQWIAFCDSDDLWHPKKLLIQLSIAEKESANLVFSEIKDFMSDNSPPFLKTDLPEDIFLRHLSYSSMLIKNRIATSSVLCLREELMQNSGFDTTHDLIAVEDYDLWLRLMEQPDFKALRINVPLVAYRRSYHSLSANKWRQARKVMRVLKRAVDRKGIGLVFPIIMPFFFICYAATSFYWRIIRKKL